MVAVLAATTGFAAVMGAGPASANQPGDRIGECVSYGSNSGAIRTGPTNRDPIRGYCTAGRQTPVRCWAADLDNPGADWLLIDDFGDPNGYGARGYINTYSTAIASLRQCAPGEQWG
ncbi:MAG: hypothetical protein ACR2JX_09125 [Mycobacteriales bacterium]